MPNAISVMRIVCSVILLFLKPMSSLFFILYILCGISDFLDGYIARKTNQTSKFGAVIDSTADLIFYAVLLMIFIPIIKMPLWVLIWIGAITIIRIGSLIIGFIRYQAIAFLHTYANKASGFALFCFPFLYNFLGLIITAGILCSMASISALEELMINITSKHLSRDVKSIFEKTKNEKSRY
ncbi:CDP-alcohol phosphatidyltransferase family protein [Oxobacter pfennigii]